MKTDKVFRNRNTIQKYFEVFITKSLISLKENKEYKTQLWSVILFDIMIFLVMIFFYSVFGELVFEFLNWSTYDFLIFFCLNMLAAKVIWMHFLKVFASRLLNGELNLYLVRPINSYFMANSMTINGANIVTGLAYLLLTILLIYFGNYSYYLLAFLIFILGCIYYLIFHNFIASLAFFMKSSEFLVNLVNRRLNFAIEEYTPKLFYKTPFQWIAFSMPSAFYAFFVMEALNGRFDLLIEFSIYLLGVFIVLFIGLIFEWHYGLKRYEAYG